MELFLDVLGETLVDTAKMLPFLFLAYLLIEYIEHRHGERIEALLAGGGRWGAVPGAVLGCVPQCGFSAIASNFYASRVITLGTLMAVYLATSDEAIPLLVSMPTYWDKLAVLMVIKVVYAIAVGFVLDFVLRGVLPKGLRGGYTGHADEVDCHEEHSDAEGNEKPIWQAALRHTLEIFVFIFAFSLVFGMIVEGVGEDVFAEMLGGMGFFQPVVAALVGLIPNCAASVLLTQLYVEGALRFSSLVAGLCTGAGVGLAVLWRANPSWKQNLFITGIDCSRFKLVRKFGICGTFAGYIFYHFTARKERRHCVKQIFSSVKRANSHRSTKFVAAHRKKICSKLLYIYLHMRGTLRSVYNNNSTLSIVTDAVCKSSYIRNGIGNSKNIAYLRNRNDFCPGIYFAFIFFF